MEDRKVISKLLLFPILPIGKLKRYKNFGFNHLLLPLLLICLLIKRKEIDRVYNLSLKITYKNGRNYGTIYPDIYIYIYTI